MSPTQQGDADEGTTPDGGPVFHRLEELAESLGHTELSPGARLGEIEIVRSLADEGRGGFGQVYEGWHRGLQQKVAVKVMLHESGELEDRFRLEAQSAAGLRHQHIIAVHDLIEWRGRPMIVMEYAEGGSLEGRLAGGRTPQSDSGSRSAMESLRESVEVCRQVAEGLQHAHAHRVIHRDIKPANILLDEDGQVKVGDFGLAKRLDEPGITQPWQRPGTPQYMSPEQVAGVVSLDARTDVYSLGVVLYRLITGALPFSDTDRSGLFKAILTASPPRPRVVRSSVPPELEAICLHALEKDPDDRYESAAALAEDLRRFLAGDSTIVKVKGPVGRGWQALRTTRAATLLAVAVAIAAVWSAVDRLVLDPWMGADLGRAPWRGAVLGAFAIPLAACLAAAGSRATKARRLGAALGVVVALGFAGGEASRLMDRVTTIHMDADRHALDALLARRTRRDVEDIEAFVSRWQERFVLQDVMRVVRSYVSRGRVQRASEWTDELAVMPGAGLISEALLALLADLTGRPTEAAGHWAQMRALDTADVNWRVWSHVGDMLRDVGLFGEALDAYTRSAGRAGAPRELSLPIAAVLIDLCRYEEAADRLREPLMDRPNDPWVLSVAVSLARRSGDFESAWARFSVMEDATDLQRDGAWGTLARKQTQCALLQSEGRDDEATLLLETLADARADDPIALEWCARTMIGRGNLEGARATYERLLKVKPDSVEALVGIVTARDATMVAELQGGRLDLAGYLEGLDKLVELLEQAITVDDSFTEAHHNLSVLDMRRRRFRSGVSVSDFEGEDLDAVIAGFGAAVERGGLNISATNNLAYFLARQASLTGDGAPLERAEQLITAALRMESPDAQSRCDDTPAARKERAGLLDTLASVQLASGRCAEALASLQQALELHPDYEQALAEFEPTIRAIDERCR